MCAILPGFQIFIQDQPTEIFLVWSQSETNEKSVHVAIENKDAIKSHLQNLLFLHIIRLTCEPLWHFRVVLALYVYRAVSLSLWACKTHCKKKNDGTPKGNLHYGNCRCARRWNSPGIEQTWKQGKRGHTREGRKRTRGNQREQAKSACKNKCVAPPYFQMTANQYAFLSGLFCPAIQLKQAGLSCPHIQLKQLVLFYTCGHLPAW